MSMSYADALTEHAAALEKNTLDCNRWQIEMQAVLLSAAPPELTKAHAAAVADANEAAQAHAAASERLQLHDKTRPALQDVAQWAKARGVLQDELTAYFAILEERRAAAALASAAIDSERLAAWVVLKNETHHANDVFFDAATMDISVQLMEVERARGRQGQAFHKRMMMQNAIESLRPNPAQKAGKQ